MQTTKFVKQPVAVSVIVEKDGRVFPRKFLWKDGQTYKIDRITRVERAASTKVGGCGIRYTVMVVDCLDTCTMRKVNGLWKTRL